MSDSNNSTKGTSIIALNPHLITSAQSYAASHRLSMKQPVIQKRSKHIPIFIIKYNNREKLLSILLYSCRNETIIGKKVSCFNFRR